MTTLADALAAIDRDFGAGSAIRGDAAPQKVEVVSSGSIALDHALGIGGLPRGRIVEIYGPESSGKTTIALHAVANAQKQGAAVFLDVEHALDLAYARDLGVDTDNLILSQPSSAEEVFEIAERLIDSNEVSIIVLDSVAALSTRRELEGDFGDANVGALARLMSQAMRKLVGKIEKTNTLFVAINQLRMKVGIVYGSPETTSGGMALKYYASQRLDIRRTATEKTGDEATGNTTKVKVVKNKLAPPHRLAEFSIIYGQGVSRELELIELGIKYGLVKKSGSWISYEGDQLGQGAEKSRQKLIATPAIANELESRLREAMQ